MNVVSDKNVTIFGNEKKFVVGDTDRRESEGDKPSLTKVARTSLY